MRILFTVLFLLILASSFCQWRKVQQLPSSDIFTIYHKDSVLYAGGKNIIYINRNNGQSWDSTTAIRQLSWVNNIIIYRTELYAAAPKLGVFKSTDGGVTWTNISAGIYPDVSDFCEYKGELYASTLGNSVYKLETVNRNHWLSFSNGLSSLSANINSITGNHNTLIAGTNNNGLYDYLPENSTTWEERFLLGQIRPNEGAYDIITGNDTLFFSGRTGKFYFSTDNGLNWNLFSKRLESAYTSMVNAGQALLLSRYIFDGVSSTSGFYYIKKDSLQNSFIQFSEMPDHFTYKIDILGNKLWNASTKGLYYLSLSDLPGISAADDAAITLPLRFLSFTSDCTANKVVLNWKTDAGQNSNHFDIEGSIDGIRWTVIGKEQVAIRNSTEKSYSFTENTHSLNNFYRIVEYDQEGSAHYSNALRPVCKTKDAYRVWPNPVHDRIFIHITADYATRAVINLFDNKGSLVKTESVQLFSGGNLVSTDINALPGGIYYLSVKSNNVQILKTMAVLKQ